MSSRPRTAPDVLFTPAALIVAALLVTGAATAPHGPGGTHRRQDRPPEAVDLYIHGGMVIDGTGAPPRRLDVAVTDGRIAWLGTLDPASVAARRRIDAAGRIVAPGFIDAHSHGDPFDTPDFENFLAMGVTTITLGQDGSHPGGADVGAWLDRVDELRPGVNIALFAGHGTVRTLAGVPLGSAATPAQLERMEGLVDAAMAAGCFGLSTGLEYRPGIFAGPEELAAVARPVGAHRGIVMSHMRSEDDPLIEQSLAELVAQGRAGGCGVHVSHIKVVYGHGAGRAGEILDLMVRARAGGVPVTADIYPYNASFTTIGIVFPDWAKPPADYAEVVATRRDELARELRRVVGYRNGAAATLLATPPWRGRTLAEVAAGLGKPFEDVLIDDIGPGGASAAYFVMDPELQQRLLLDDHVMISTDGSPDMHHPRGYGAFARIIREDVVEKNLFTLEKAVWKMTGLTAQTLGLIRERRGLLQPEWAADIVVFDPARVRDAADFTEPHRLAEGFDCVIVNGVVTRTADGLTGERGGRALRHLSSQGRGGL